MNGKTLLAQRKKYKHFSQNKIDTICNKVDLQQLLYWYDETLLEYRHNKFYLTGANDIVIYPNMGYNHYSGSIYTPIQVLTDILKLNYADALYLLSYFYYKIKKEPINNALTDWTALSYHNRLATERNNNIDLDYIVSEDLFQSNDTEQKAYAYRRAIAYLCDKRNIDRDIVLNFIKQGFLKMDKQYNLCFVTYTDPLAKSEVIAIAKKGTTDKRFCPNYVKECHTGFFCARKPNLESKDYKELYIFESAVDLLSFLTLIKTGRIELIDHDHNACYIALNGVGNHAYIQKTLERYQTIERVNLCLDNDTSGIEVAQTIAEQLSPRYEVEDLRVPLLKRNSGKQDKNSVFIYCKDYNDLLTIETDIQIAV